MSCAFVKKYFDMASNNTLADNDEKLSSERFLWLTDDHVEKFLEAQENKNSRRNTDSDVALVSCKLLNIF